MDDAGPSSEPCEMFEYQIDTPCLLPERHLVITSFFLSPFDECVHQVDSIRVVKDRYYELKLEGDVLDALYQTHRVYVKRFCSMVPYELGNAPLHPLHS